MPPSQFVRVDLGRLDELMRLIGDLVITRARLADSLARVERHVPPVEWRAVQENSLAIDRHLRDLREGVVRVRMVPVSEIFRRMPFVVRDLAREDKKVRLEIAGQDTELDKFLIERMMDPILHLVRNAVSHGLETIAERRAAGKTDEGLLTLSAAAVGDTVVLEITDDGRGIDAAAVARRARDNGIEVPDGPQSALGHEALLDILCAPGFSTREAADLASGRGVGMAVVKNTVQELGGALTLDTVAGHGTRFAIELPLTLAITDAIIGTVGDRNLCRAAVRRPRGDRSGSRGGAGAREQRDRGASRRRAAARQAGGGVRHRAAAAPPAARAGGRRGAAERSAWYSIASWGSARSSCARSATR